jgi:hypothetical protein
VSNDNDTARDLKVAEWRRRTLTRAVHAVVAASGMSSSGGKIKGPKTMTHERKDLTTRDTEIENISRTAQDDGGFEKILKFNKGTYAIGDEEIAVGAEFVAHVPAWTKCWIKFRDGKVVERKLYRVAAGEQPVEREELDDRDSKTWPDGLDGKPSDAWVLQNLLPLENLETNEVIIFASPSTGGKISIGDLSRLYTRRARKVANCGLPIIKLAVSSFPSPKFGKVSRPHFEIVGWDEPSADSDIEVMPPTTPTTPTTSSKNEFDDSIPF